MITVINRVDKYQLTFGTAIALPASGYRRMNRDAMYNTPPKKEFQAWCERFGELRPCSPTQALWVYPLAMSASFVNEEHAHRARAAGAWQYVPVDMRTMFARVYHIKVFAVPTHTVDDINELLKRHGQTSGGLPGPKDRREMAKLVHTALRTPVDIKWEAVACKNGRAAPKRKPEVKQPKIKAVSENRKPVRKPKLLDQLWAAKELREQKQKELEDRMYILTELNERLDRLWPSRKDHGFGVIDRWADEV